MSDHPISNDTAPTLTGAEPDRHQDRPSITHWLALLLVVLILTPMALWPALDTFRPVTQVQVARALPEITLVAETPSPTDTAAPAQSPTRTVQAPGWIEPDPYYTAVSALADGVIESIHVLEGESVQAGQLLANLVSEDATLSLRQAEAQVQAMEAALARAHADQAAATTDWDEPVQREREVATSSAALAEAQAELERLPAEIRAIEAEQKRWQEEHRRVSQAYKQGAATEREILITEYELASREAGLESINLRLGVLQARVERLRAEATAAERAADLRVAERLAVDRATADVSDARAALDHATAQRDEARLRLDRMTIASPIDGLVLRRFKAPGDKVRLGMDDPHSSHIVHLYDPRRLQVRVDVPLADAPHLRIGQPCEVVVDVLPDRVFAGEVSRITHEADLQKNTLQVKVRVLDPANILKPEMLTRVKFIGDDAVAGPSIESAGTPSELPANPNGHVVSTDRVRIPDSCLDGPRVWVVRGRRGLSGRVAPIPVQAIDRDAGFMTVEGALSVGDLVVEQPAGLSPGQRVKVSTQEGGVV